jgi:hypothetical protein
MRRCDMHKLALSTVFCLVLIPSTANADLPPTPQPLFEDDSCNCQNRNFGCVNIDQATGLVDTPQFDDSPHTRQLVEAAGFSKMCSGRPNAKAKTNEVWCPPRGKEAIFAARAAAHGTVVGAASSSPKAEDSSKSASSTDIASSPKPKDSRVPTRRGCALGAFHSSAAEVDWSVLSYVAVTFVALRRTRR